MNTTDKFLPELEDNFEVESLKIEFGVKPDEFNDLNEEVKEEIFDFYNTVEIKEEEVLNF